MVTKNRSHGYNHVVTWGLLEYPPPSSCQTGTKLPLRARPAWDEHVVQNNEWTSFHRCYYARGTAVHWLSNGISGTTG